jgi:hypothetical protein
MQFPFVSRKKYRRLESWKLEALEALRLWDPVAEFVR